MVEAVRLESAVADSRARLIRTALRWEGGGETSPIGVADSDAALVFLWLTVPARL